MASQQTIYCESLKCATFFDKKSMRLTYRNGQIKAKSANKPKKITRTHEGRRSMGPLPPYFPFIRLTWCLARINEVSLYFQFIETTWYLIGVHGNHSHINDVSSGRHLGFSNFQIFFIFKLNTENGEITKFSDWNLQNCKILCKVKLSVLSHF